MNSILDIAVVIIILIFAVMGYKKGLIKSLISFIGSIVASLMSMVLAKPIAEAIYNGSVKNAVISKIESAFKLVQQEGGNFLDNLMDTMPDFVQNSVGNFGITSVDLASAANHGSAQIETTLAPVFISFITLITAIILFVVLSIIAKIVCTVVGQAMELFSLSFIDSVIGAGIGIVKGFILVLFLAFVLRISIPHMQNPPEFLSEQAISQNVVFKEIYNSSVVTTLVSAVTDSPNTGVVE